MVNLSTKKYFLIPIPEALLNDSFNIEDLNSYYFQNVDSIFLLHKYQLSLIDSSGRIKWKQTINAPLSEHLPDLVHFNFQKFFPVIYNQINKHLYIRQYSGKYFNWNFDFYKIPIECYLNLPDTNFISLPTAYPTMFQTNYFGDAQNVFREINDSLHIYTFSGDSWLYAYNIYNNQLRVFNCPTKKDNNSAEPLDTAFHKDMNRRMDHLVENPLYMKLVYDKFRKMYYRFYLNKLPLKNKDNTYNTVKDKKLSILFINQDFTVIGEKEIPNSTIWLHSFVNSQGLYLFKSIKKEWLNGKQNAVKLVFDIYNFQ